MYYTLYNSITPLSGVKFNILVINLLIGGLLYSFFRACMLTAR